MTMNAQKFTQKSLEAIGLAQDTAIEYQNMQVEQQHLLYALLTQEFRQIQQRCITGSENVMFGNVRAQARELRKIVCFAFGGIVR